MLFTLMPNQSGGESTALGVSVNLLGLRFLPVPLQSKSVVKTRLTCNNAYTHALLRNLFSKYQYSISVTLLSPKPPGTAFFSCTFAKQVWCKN